MPVNIDSTSKKYHGRMAETYETKRKKQERWDIENAEVAKMLKKLRPKTVLDVPVGTGRFIPVYAKIGVKEVFAVDVSDTMIDLAKQKKRGKTKVRFRVKDVRKLGPIEVDVAVCVRFLDLIDEAAMLSVVKRLIEYTDKAIICTIRLGDEYVPKSNTATHDRAKFEKLLKKFGWKVAKRVPVFNQGWFILLLKPRS